MTTPTTTSTSWPASRVLGLIGLILYIGTGVFPYLASGLVAPLWGIAVLYAGWLVGLWLTIRLFRRGSAWALAMQVAAVAFWWVVVTMGESSSAGRRSDSRAVSSSHPWWRSAVVYQVYLRSFADGDGDGTGDIAGLRSRLPYIRSLGVDAIWINPWYVSPLNDGGYDVADYRTIDPRFGTLEEAIGLIGEAKGLGLRVLLDLVPNHTSTDHVWFQEALASAPGSRARTRYHFRPGRGSDGAEPPTDWISVFGGRTWSRVGDGEWYLHLFDSTQPDLNWANPEVRAEFVDIIRFWLDRGASGFRVDVANGLEKDPTYPDFGAVEKPKGIPGGDHHPYSDRDPIHEIVREWRSVVDEYPDAILVAEAWVENWDRLARYLRPDEYHQAFNFEFMESPWEEEAMRSAISTAVPASAAVGAVPTWVLSNHDIVRQVTRYGLPQTLDARDWLLDGDRGLFDGRARPTPGEGGGTPDVGAARLGIHVPG